jgi:glutaredoxin
MKRLIYIPLLTATCLIICSCQKKGGDDSQKTNKPDTGILDINRIKISKDDDHFVFTYMLADGSFESVDKMDDIPEEAKNQVIVIDTKLSPEQRLSSKVIYVADLTDQREDGTFHSRPVSRYKFERNLLREPSQASGVLPEECKDLAVSPTDRIVLYSTTWCGVCKAAAEFFKKEGIPFENKDIESTPSAQQELACKALKSGKKPNGVPVIDIGGTLMLGFDRDDILRLYKNLKKNNQKSSAANPQPKSPTSQVQ